MPSSVPAEIDPSDTMRTTTVSTTRPITSSATAAPSTVRASTRGERPQIAEDPRGDADAGGGKRGAEEQRRVVAVVEELHRAEAGGHRDDDADRSDARRRPTDGAELAEIHLEPDLEQEEDHAELAEHRERLVRAHEVEDRRADHDAGEDLGDDRREPDPFGELRGELGRDEEDQDVEEDSTHIHFMRSGADPD